MSGAGAATNDHHAGRDTNRGVVVGSGPNGLAAAVVLARAGWSVTVREAADELGGGVRSGSLTLPGFLHDLGSAVHPLALASPFFRELPLSAHGLEWVQPPIPLAHPLDDGPPVLLHRSLAETAAGLGARDGERYRRLVQRFVDDWDGLCSDLLAPLPPLRLPAHPVLMARFGGRAIIPAASLARHTFRDVRARSLFGGLAAHSLLPLTALGSSGFALVLGVAAHTVGWPMPRGGAGALSAALGRYVTSLGGMIRTGAPVRSLSDVEGADAVLFDLAPRQVLTIAGPALPGRERRALARFRHGPGAFKVDWALSAPIPWRNAECARAGTVHLGGTLGEMIASEVAPWRGQQADRPFVLLVQPSLFDATRAPAGRHTAWAYCHVPNGSDFDMLSRIEDQVERYAPGFRDVILARSVMAPSKLQAYDENLVGGDVGGGANLLRQVLFRPTIRRTPYRLGLPNTYLCSASTPPGGGVHGMCGYHAACVALADNDRRRRRRP
jgi:phytoene dehydrogenase-like protein